jgi:hypothetical protein
MTLWRAALLAVALSAACGGGMSCPNDLPPSCPSPMPSFSTTVNPIIHSTCVSCHGPGGQQVSMPFTSYDLIFKSKDRILTQVYACRMPPEGNPQLTAAERQQVLGWLVCDAPNN